MSRFRRMGLFAAMEDDEVVVPPEDTPEETVPATTVEAEQAVNDTEEGAGELEAMADAVDDAGEDTETLEKTSDVLEDTVESGEGADPATAEVANIVVESICARLGVKFKKRIIPAKEAFGGKTSRLEATKIAVEGIQSALNTVYTKVKEFLKVVYQKIQEFIARFFANADKVKAHAEALKKKAEAAGDKSVGETKINVGGVAKSFVSSGKLNGGAITSVIQNHIKLTETLVQTPEVAIAIYGQFAAAAQKAVADADNKDAAQTAANEGVAKAIDAAKTVYSKVFKIEEADGGFKGRFGPVINDAFLEISFNGNGFGIALADSKDGGEIEDTEIFAMPASEVIKSCDNVIELMTHTSGVKAKAGEFKKCGDDAVKLIDTVVSGLGKANDDNQKALSDSLAKIRGGSVQVANFVNRYMSLLPAANVRLGNQVLGIGEKSLGVLGKGSAEPKPGDKGEPAPAAA